MMVKPTEADEENAVEGDVFDGWAMQLIVWAWVAVLLTVTLASYQDYRDWSDQMKTYRRRRDTEADLNGVDFSRAARQAFRMRRRPARAASVNSERRDDTLTAVDGQEPWAEEEAEQAPSMLARQPRRRRRRRREDKELSYYADQARRYADYPQEAWRPPQPSFRRRRAWVNNEGAGAMFGRGAGISGGGMAPVQKQKRSQGMLGNGGQQMEEREEGLEEKSEEKRRYDLGADQAQGAVRNVRAPESEGDVRKRPGGAGLHGEQWRSPQERGFASFEGGAKSPALQRQRRWWGNSWDTGGGVRSPRGWFSSGNRKASDGKSEEGRAIENRIIRSGYQDPYGAARYQSASADDAFLGFRGSRAAQRARGASAYHNAAKLQHVDQASGPEQRHKMVGESKSEAESESQQLPQYESEQRDQQESQGWEEEYPEERVLEREAGVPMSWEEQRQLAKEACIQKRMSAGEGGYGVCEPAGYLEEYNEEAEEPVHKRGYILPDLEEVEYGEPIRRLNVEEAKPLLEERGKREFYYQPESRRALRRVHRKLPDQDSYPERRRRFIPRARAQDADQLLTKGGNRLRNFRFHRRRQVQNAEQHRGARLAGRAHRMKAERQERYRQQQQQQQGQPKERGEQEHEAGVQAVPAAAKDNWMIGDLQMEGDSGAEQEAEAKEAEEERLGRREYGDDKRNIFNTGSRTTRLDFTTRFWMILLVIITTLSTLLISSVPILLPYS